MKPLRYRLQPLLDLKLKARQKAEAILAKAIGRLQEEKKRLAKLEQEKKEIIEHRKAVRRELHQKVSTGHALVKDGSSRIAFLKRLEEEEKAKDRVGMRRAIEAYGNLA